MKQIKPLIILSICVALLSSCFKTGTNVPTSTSGVTFKFNGTTKATSLVFANYIKSFQTLQIVGKVGTGTETIGLTIDSVKVGTFDMDRNNLVFTYGTSADFNNTYIGTSGTVSVSTFTGDEVAGTFNFTGMRPDSTTAVISEGKFAAKYTTQ